MRTNEALTGLLREALSRLEDHHIAPSLQKDIRAALASAPPAAEPVAWRVSHDGEWHYFDTRDAAARERHQYESYEATRADGDREHQEPQPLYAAPQPAEPPRTIEAAFKAMEALLDPWKKDGWVLSLYQLDGNKGMSSCWVPDWKDGGERPPDAGLWRDGKFHIKANNLPAQPATQAGAGERHGDPVRQAFIRGWDERGKAHQLRGSETTDRFMNQLLGIYYPRNAAQPTEQPSQDANPPR